MSRAYFGGLTYSSHPISCAAAIAAVGVLRDEDMVGNAARLDSTSSRRIGFKSLSHHLAHLRAAGLVFATRSGKSIRYQLADNRVRFRQRKNGQILLRILAPSGEVSVTIMINPPPSKP